MSSKRSGRGVSRPRQPLTKAMLLPMDQASAREQSLSYHLALAVCRDGHGNERVECYKMAEYAVEAALELADRLNEWILAEDAIPVFKRLLALHDAQLATAPLHKVIEAKRQFRLFLAGTAPSPIPEPDLGSAENH